MFAVDDVPFILDGLDDEAQCRTDAVDGFIEQFLAYRGFPGCVETPVLDDINGKPFSRRPRALTAIGCASPYPSSAPF